MSNTKREPITFNGVAVEPAAKALTIDVAMEAKAANLDDDELATAILMLDEMEFRLKDRASATRKRREELVRERTARAVADGEPKLPFGEEVQS